MKEHKQIFFIYLLNDRTLAISVRVLRDVSLIKWIHLSDKLFKPQVLTLFEMPGVGT